MRRRSLIAALGGTAATWPLSARAQQPSRTYRLGALTVQPRTQPHYVAFVDELRQFGFIEGRNLQIDWQGFGLRTEQLAPHMSELVKVKVDAILAGTGPSTRVAREATSTIPILTLADDMIGEGIVHSLARPEANTTGVSLLATELDGKRQEVLIELLPGVRRLAALADSRLAEPYRLQALQKAARAGGIDLTIYKVGTPEEIAPAIDAAKAAGASGLNVLASVLLFINHRIILERTAALGLPAIYQWPEYVHEGALMGYGPTLVRIYREQMARLMAAMLRGTRPADLPVQQPTTFQLAINLKTAKALGVTVPPLLLARADEVIE